MVSVSRAEETFFDSLENLRFSWEDYFRKGSPEDYFRTVFGSSIS